MTADVRNNVRNFQFSFPTCTVKELKYELEVPIEIPFKGSTREFTQRLISTFRIPVFVEDGNFTVIIIPN